MEAQKTTIDKFEFELQPLPAWDYYEASLRMVQLLGPSILPISKLVASSESTSEKIDMKMVGAIITALRVAPVPEVMSLSKMILKDCLVRGDLDSGKGEVKFQKLDKVFDSILRGKLMTIYKLLGWAIQVNFSGFFEDMKSALPSPSEPVDSSQSQKASAAGGPVAG